MYLAVCFRNWADFPDENDESASLACSVNRWKAPDVVLALNLLAQRAETEREVWAVMMKETSNCLLRPRLQVIFTHNTSWGSSAVTRWKSSEEASLWAGATTPSHHTIGRSAYPLIRCIDPEQLSENKLSALSGLRSLKRPRSFIAFMFVVSWRRRLRSAPLSHRWRSGFREEALKLIWRQARTLKSNPTAAVILKRAVQRSDRCCPTASARTERSRSFVALAGCRLTARQRPLVAGWSTFLFLWSLHHPQRGVMSSVVISLFSPHSVFLCFSSFLWRQNEANDHQKSQKSEINIVSWIIEGVWGWMNEFYTFHSP